MNQDAIFQVNYKGEIYDVYGTIFVPGSGVCFVICDVNERFIYIHANKCTRA
jgi:hypothetical protein